LNRITSTFAATLLLHNITGERRSAPPLRRNHQWPVFDKGPGIAKSFDIFPRGTLPSLPPPRNRIRPRRIKPNRVPLKHLSQVGGARDPSPLLQSCAYAPSIVRNHEKRKTDTGLF